MKILFNEIPLNNDNRAVDFVIVYMKEHSIHFCMFRIEQSLKNWETAEKSFKKYQVTKFEN